MGEIIIQIPALVILPQPMQIAVFYVHTFPLPFTKHEIFPFLKCFCKVFRDVMYLSSGIVGA